ncbi:MAG: branched-chain amino acid ABC transporter permease [Rhodoblastus sp.]
MSDTAMNDTGLHASQGGESRAMAYFRQRAKWRWPEYAFWIAAVAIAFLFPARVPLFTEIAILALFALSLDIVLGYAGIVSLGHGAFFGLGAYTAGLLAKAGGGAGLLSDPTFGLLAAAVLCAIAGYVTSFLVLRGADLTRLMVTLGVALIFAELANRMAWLTGGADGLQGVAVGKVLGVFGLGIFTPKNSYFYALTVLFLLFVVARKMVNSPYGVSLRAIKGNALRAGAIGINVNRRLNGAYTMGAAYAGVAGALLAQTAAFVSLDVLDFHRSADVMLIVIFGGVGSLYGALVGAAAFKFLYDLLAAATPQYWQFWLGLILVLLVLFVRGGIMGLMSKIYRRLSGRGGAA